MSTPASAKTTEKGTKRDKDKITETPGRKLRTRSTSVRKKKDDSMETEGDDILNPPSILKKKETGSPLKKKQKPPRRSKTPKGRGRSNPPRSKSRDAKSVDDAASQMKKKTPKSKTSEEASPQTYATKAATPSKKIKLLKNKTFVQGTITVRKQDGLRHYVYGKLGLMLSTMQKVTGAKNCRIINYQNEKTTPLQAASQMPTDHVLVEQFFYFHGARKQFNGLTIPENRNRKITFSFCLNADIDVAEIVDAVTVDLIDHQIELEVKTCQAVRHEDLMHLVGVHNKFNHKCLERELQRQLTELQMSEFKRDPRSFLGTLQEAGREMPKIYVTKKYPHNGPWEKNSAGVDTSYKQMFIIEYATVDKDHVEHGFELLKRSGTLKAIWGEHATVQLAPPKGDETVSQSTVDDWHSMCYSHNATILSMGLLKFDDIRNPDFEVDVEFWKKGKKDKTDVKMSLRDVLRSIKVQGKEREVQVLQSLCPAPDGGYEVSVADTLQNAKTLARNIATHPAGWIYGYLQAKGWKKASIVTLMKKSFTPTSIMSAQTSTFDKKTGRVTSDAVSSTELEIRALENSWVDLSLGTPKAAKVEGAQLKEGDIAAFDFEDGASVKTLTRDNGSESEGEYTECSYVESSSDEDSEDGDGSDDDDLESVKKGVLFDMEDAEGMETQEEESTGETMEEGEAQQEEAADDGGQSDEDQASVSTDEFDESNPLEWFIRGFFEESNKEMMMDLLAKSRAGEIPPIIWDKYTEFKEYVDGLDGAKERAAKLEKSGLEGDKYDVRAEQIHADMEYFGYAKEGALIELEDAMTTFWHDFKAYEEQDDKQALGSAHGIAPVASPDTQGGEPDATNDGEHLPVDTGGGSENISQEEPAGRIDG